MPANDESGSSLRRSKRSSAQIANEKNHEIYTHDSKEKKPLKRTKMSETKKSPSSKVKEVAAEEEAVEEEIKEMNDLEASISKPRKRVTAKAKTEENEKKSGEDDKGVYSDACFVGEPLAVEEARLRWPHRYETKDAGRKTINSQREEEGASVQAKHHYNAAKVDDILYTLTDDAYVKAEEGEPDYLGHIVELFEGIDDNLYCTVLWFFRAEDTVIKIHSENHDARRVFLSDDKNDIDLSSLLKKVRIVRVPPGIDLSVRDDISNSDLYYDMSFSVGYSSFTSLPPEDIPSIPMDKSVSNAPLAFSEKSGVEKKELSLLDLYSGCGAMSTGLCLGANLSGVNLKTCWAVDMNEFACQSLQYNHPEAQVRNEAAEDFLALLHEWDILLKRFGVGDDSSDISDNSIGVVVDEEVEDDSILDSEEYEVDMIIGICFGKQGEAGDLKERGLKFKVRWKGYSSDHDSWEPAHGLNECQDKIRQFVIDGYKNNILPLPGKVDVLCGGPPCQGISGFNRFRKADNPFEDEKNKQMAVFMNIVDYLKPRYVLMENVVDILKFAKGYLGRYALSRLVGMRYQARMGILAAGNYGLPQYRMRVFLWGAQPNEKLPQLPLPTHDAVNRGAPPVEFETHVVAFEQGRESNLEKALLLEDALSDLPPVKNNEGRDEMRYQYPSKTEFQRYIRLSRDAMTRPLSAIQNPSQNEVLFDHRPLQLNEDDYQRVCRIPKFKGANFRHLPGVIIGPNNVVQWDPSVERVLLPSGKPLIPEYAMTFVGGKSSKPFGRLWWDEIVPTVVTRAEPHNQAIIHPEQDRVLTIRENARIQGFPDHYKLFGPVKARYIQVGNAVAVPVSRALGYGLAMAILGNITDDEPVFSLPQNFPINL